MSDGVIFLDFPVWDDMDFKKDCKAWGAWYATFRAPNPMDTTESMDGDPWSFILYFISSLPENWSPPRNWTQPALYGHILDWYGYNW